MEGNKMEPEAIVDLMRERDRLKDLLELLERGETEEAKKKIQRDITTITEALESK